MRTVELFRRQSSRDVVSISVIRSDHPSAIVLRRRGAWHIGLASVLLGTLEGDEALRAAWEQAGQTGSPPALPQRPPCSMRSS